MSFAISTWILHYLPILIFLPGIHCLTAALKLLLLQLLLLPPNWYKLVESKQQQVVKYPNSNRLMCNWSVIDCQSFGYCYSMDPFITFITYMENVRLPDFSSCSWLKFSKHKITLNYLNLPSVYPSTIMKTSRSGRQGEIFLLFQLFTAASQHTVTLCYSVV